MSTVKKKVTAPSRKQHGAKRLNLQTPLVIAQPDDKPNQNDVQLLNVTQENILSKLEEIESKIGEIAQNIDRISKVIEDIQAYSYQYNLKIVGVPQAETTEKATDTVELCLKVFAGIGVDVSPCGKSVWHIEFQQEPKMASEEATCPSYVNLPVVWLATKSFQEEKL